MKQEELKEILEDIDYFFEKLKERYLELRKAVDLLTFKYSQSKVANQRRAYHELWVIFEDVQGLLDIIDDDLKILKRLAKNGAKKTGKTTKPKKGKRNDAK